MARDAVPMAVLSQQIADAIGGRRVRTAVFTTFTFDPGFFELNVLPLLFDQTFGQADKLRRIQLEDALRSVDHVAVYYDRSGLSQDAEPGSLDYRRIDVRRQTGCFHPKVILLLVDEPAEEGTEYDTGGPPRSAYQTLIFGVLSANLTRAGWWENVECAHVEEVADKDLADQRCPWRRDLLALIERIRTTALPTESHEALDAVHGFVRDRLPTAVPKTVSVQGRYHSRVFCGQRRLSFADWLDELRLGRYAWNLEIISPYFDQADSKPLAQLLEVLRPREVRVYLPRDLDGTARVTRDLYEDMVCHDGVYWAELPGAVTARGRSETFETLSPRQVHAKVYRIWQRQGNDLLIIGSVNLTSAAHSQGNAGNVEAAILVDVTGKQSARRWLLERTEREIGAFVEEVQKEEDGLDTAVVDVSIRYDWASGKLSYLMSDRKAVPIEACELSGDPLFTIKTAVADKWIDCDEHGAKRMRQALSSSSFVELRHVKGSWRVFVREENLAYRPSLLTTLTAEEIMEYWSLLTPDQRAAFIERMIDVGVEIEGLPVHRSGTLVSHNTLFDRFAGIYHAFGCLRKYIDTAIEEGRPSDAEARLFGAKYDSLPSLLGKTLDRAQEDPIAAFVTFLSARQLCDYVAKEYREFTKSMRDRASALDDLLARLPEIRSHLPLEAIPNGEEFLDWYEQAFLTDVGIARGRA